MLTLLLSLSAIIIIMWHRSLHNKFEGSRGTICYHNFFFSKISGG